MTIPSKRIFIVAGEPSGEAIGADLIRSLRKSADGPIDIGGVGGAKMAALDVSSDVDIKPLSILGPFEGLKNYRVIQGIIRKTVEEITRFQPDTLVLIDSWGFTIRVAQQYRKANPDCKIIKYIGPQVFASRPGRARTAAEAFDHLLTIHSFDGHFFEKEGLATSFVGNPALMEGPEGNARDFLKKYNPEARTVLLVLFGSRTGEVTHLSDTFLEAIQIVRQDHPDLLVVSALADNVATQIRAKAAEDPRLQDIVLLPACEKENLLAAADIALACSGTVTLELAQMGIPMVIGYRMDPVSSFTMKHFVFKAKYACLLNLAVNAEIVPEFLLARCTGAALASALHHLLVDEEARHLQKDRVRLALEKMRGGKTNPAKMAAEKILELTR
jgi:lipid-A-disaccharide synthase